MIITIPNMPGFAIADDNENIRLAVLQRPPDDTLANWRKIYADCCDELDKALDEYFPVEVK